MLTCYIAAVLFFRPIGFITCDLSTLIFHGEFDQTRVAGKSFCDFCQGIYRYNENNTIQHHSEVACTRGRYSCRSRGAVTYYHIAAERIATKFITYQPAIANYSDSSTDMHIPLSNIPCEAHVYVYNYNILLYYRKIS